MLIIYDETNVHNITKIHSCNYIHTYMPLMHFHYVLSCVTRGRTPTDITKLAVRMTAARTMVTSRTTLEMKA